MASRSPEAGREKSLPGLGGEVSLCDRRMRDWPPAELGSGWPLRTQDLCPDVCFFIIYLLLMFGVACCVVSRVSCVAVVCGDG